MVEETNPVVLQGALLEPELTPSKTLYIMNDGGMVPMREGKWNEVKVGVLFREENHHGQREGSRGTLTRPRYVAVLGEQEEFRNQMNSAYVVENAVAANRVAWLGDGALGNWNLASMVAPSAIQILDWMHAVENGMKCGKALLGECDSALPTWKRRIEELLWTGSIEDLVAELKECRELAEEKTTSAVDDLIRYYETNANRMRYSEFVAKGLLIGTGIVESAHRHVIQTRMKKAGQHWGNKGGRQMARLRAAYRTAGPAKFYASIRWAHRQSQRAHLPAKPIKRRASNR